MVLLICVRFNRNVELKELKHFDNLPDNIKAKKCSLIIKARNKFINELSLPNIIQTKLLKSKYPTTVSIKNIL